MDFKEFSEKYKNIKSPGISEDLDHKESDIPSNLLEMIKKENAKSKKYTKRFYIIFAITAIVYVLIFIVNPDPDLTLINRIAGSCYVIASLILFTLFWRKHKKIKNTSYLASPKEFLEEAKTRFQFWNPNQWWLLVVVVLVDIGASFSLLRYLGEMDKTIGIIIFQFIYILLLIFGFYMGKKEWIKTKKPLYTEIENMLSGFAE